MTVLYTAYNALLSLVTTVAGVPVFDGPQPKWATDFEYIVLGCDDIFSTAPTVAIDSGNQDWLDLGAFTREETFGIHGVHIAWSGATDFAALRAKATTTLGLIETAVRVNPTGIQLGTALAPTGWCGLSVLRAHMVQTDKGATLATPFVVACTTRLGSQ